MLTANEAKELGKYLREVFEDQRRVEITREQALAVALTAVSSYVKTDNAQNAMIKAAGATFEYYPNSTGIGKRITVEAFDD